MSDPTVAAYEAALDHAKSAIIAAIQAAAQVTRPGLPAWHLVDLAASQLGIEVAAARRDLLQAQLVQPGPTCLLCGKPSPEAGVCADCEWNKFTEENR